MFASRSTRESESSAKPGSSCVRGEWSDGWASLLFGGCVVGVWEVRKEVRERERRGVVGRFCVVFEDIPD